MINRWFLRCTGCLEVMALESDFEPNVFRTNPKAPTCGICGSTLENMGRVQRDRLVTDTMLCKCDDRCTSARGPLCQCACGGKNHGHGMAGYLRVSDDAGAVPVLLPQSETRIAAARIRFAEYQAAVAPFRERHAELTERKREGWIPRDVFDRWLALDRLLADVRKAKIHSSRMKKLTAA